MENNKVTKKISEDQTIDYYFLNTEKVIELIKFEIEKEREATEREAKERVSYGFI
jgi:hypothetical protein